MRIVQYRPPLPPNPPAPHKLEIRNSKYETSSNSKIQVPNNIQINNIKHVWLEHPDAIGKATGSNPVPPSYSPVCCTSSAMTLFFPCSVREVQGFWNPGSSPQRNFSSFLRSNLPGPQCSQPEGEAPSS